MTLRITLLLILLFSAWPCYGLDVVFRSSAQVEGVNTTLGDIAEISENNELAKALSSQIIGKSPAPGHEIILDARKIIASIIKDNGPLDSVFWKGSSGIKLKREFVTVNPGKVIDIITNFIENNRERLPKAVISFKAESLPMPFLLPTGRQSYDVIPSSPGIIGSTRFTVIFKVDGHVRKNLSVRGYTEAIAPVVVAKKRLKYGEIISPDKIGLALRDISKIANHITDPAVIVGSSVKRALKNGSVVDSDAIEEPPVVRRGELVKIIVNHNGLLLTATGIAKTNGKKNDIIRVKNASSNKLVFCRVHSPGLVEVKI